jgi:hypothetical protein
MGGPPTTGDGAPKAHSDERLIGMFRACILKDDLSFGMGGVNLLAEAIPAGVV